MVFRRRLRSEKRKEKEKMISLPCRHSLCPNRTGSRLMPKLSRYDKIGFSKGRRKGLGIYVTRVENDAGTVDTRAVSRSLKSLAFVLNPREPRGVWRKILPLFSALSSGFGITIEVIGRSDVIGTVSTLCSAGMSTADRATVSRKECWAKPTGYQTGILH